VSFVCLHQQCDIELELCIPKPSFAFGVLTCFLCWGVVLVCFIPHLRQCTSCKHVVGHEHGTNAIMFLGCVSGSCCAAANMIWAMVMNDCNLHLVCFHFFVNAGISIATLMCIVMCVPNGGVAVVAVVLR
jgi:hypothetical protein